MPPPADTRSNPTDLHPASSTPRTAKVLPLPCRGVVPQSRRSSDESSSPLGSPAKPARMRAVMLLRETPPDDNEPPAWAAEQAADEVMPESVDEGLIPAPRRGRLVEADEGTLAALVERIIDRDERALALLYDATSARVHGLVLRITRRAALAEEVVEDTFWQVWRQAPRFDAARGKVVTWLLAMARSRAIDALRRDERFQHAELPEEGSDDDEDTAAIAAHDLLDATRGQQRVHEAVAALEPRARQLIALAFFRGLTHEEIAAQTTMPLGTVKSLIRRALLQLRELLADAAR